MPRGRPRKLASSQPLPVSPQKMSVDEVENLKKDIQEKEDIVKNVDGLSIDLETKSHMQHQINRTKAILERDESLVAVGSEKDRIQKRIREIEEQIVKDRPTTDEMNIPLGTLESSRAVQKNIAFHKKHIQAEIELQNLRKRLEPSDPYAQNLEYARPDKYGKKTTFIMG
jgi:hypothetical protein